jgi:hypothetical protein
MGEDMTEDEKTDQRTRSTWLEKDKDVGGLLF